MDYLKAVHEAEKEARDYAAEHGDTAYYPYLSSAIEVKLQYAIQELKRCQRRNTQYVEIDQERDHLRDAATEVLDALDKHGVKLTNVPEVERAIDGLRQVVEEAE